MSIAFSRSVRSLDSAKSWRSILMLFLVMVFLSLWIAWFLLARVSIYKVADRAYLQTPRMVVAEFAPAALAHIRAGQSAQLRLDGFPWPQYGPVSASVLTVSNGSRDGHVRVELQVQSEPASRILLQPGLTGSVEIEVARLSPAELVMRAAGLRLGGETSMGE